MGNRKDLRGVYQVTGASTLIRSEFIMKKHIMLFFLYMFLCCANSTYYNPTEDINNLQGKWYAKKQSIVRWSKKIVFVNDSFYLQYNKAVDQLQVGQSSFWSDYSKGKIFITKRHITFHGIYTDSLFYDRLKNKVHPRQETGSYNEKLLFDFYKDSLRIASHPNDSDFLLAWIFGRE